jgi:hypothetical protein
MKRKNNITSIPLDYEALKFCHKKGYKVYPVTDDNIHYQVEVTLGTKKGRYKDIYTSVTIHKALAETYTKIYNKRK